MAIFNDNKFNCLSSLELGDLGRGPSKLLDYEQVDRDNFYQSSKFIVGYQEIQAIWAKSATKSDQGNAINQMNVRKQSLTLPLIVVNRPNQQSLEEHNKTSEHDNYSSCSSYTVSPADSGLPSPQSSCNSPATDSINCFLSPTICHHGSKIFGRYKSQTNFVQNENQNIFNRQTEARTKVMGSHFLSHIKKMIPRFILRKRDPSSPVISDMCSHDQVVDLEVELEKYRKLSETKKKAAELLKFQLMEALYDRVMVEIEKKHERRRLEAELTKKEWELSLLQSITENNQRTWCSRYTSLQEDMEGLKQQLRGISEQRQNIALQKWIRGNDFRRCSL